MPRVPASFPAPYLGANVPQAWAAGAIFRLVAILCGIHATFEAGEPKLYVNPALPDWLPEITLHNLRVGNGALEIHCRDGAVDVLSNTSGFTVMHSPAPGPLGSRGAVSVEPPKASGSQELASTGSCRRR
jgi:hypothetical protein